MFESESKFTLQTDQPAGQLLEHGFKQGQYPGPPRYLDFSPDPNQFKVGGVPHPSYHEGGMGKAGDDVEVVQAAQENDGEKRSGTYVVPATQPVIAVPVVQEIQRRERLIEVPQTIIVDKIIPKVYHQEVFHEVPNLDISFNNKVIEVPEIEIKEKIIEIPVATGLDFKIKPVWRNREVPRVFPRYMGEENTIIMDVPRLKVVEKRIEKEVPVYVGEKIVKVPKYEEEYYEIFDYRYVPVEEEVPVYRYKPVIDVEVDIPAPLLVPVPLEPTTNYLEPVRMSWNEYQSEKNNSGSGACNIKSGSCC